MKTVALYRWQVQWLSKWVTTSYLADEETIRRSHPEAVRLDHTLELRELPETSDELMQNTPGGRYLGSTG
jgi:hypothetical protein